MKTNEKQGKKDEMVQNRVEIQKVVFLKRPKEREKNCGRLKKISRSESCA